MFGYIPTDDDMKAKKKNDQALAKPIPHMYESFPIREDTKPDDIGGGICGLYEETNVVIEEEVDLDGICDVEPGEML